MSPIVTAVLATTTCVDNFEETFECNQTVALGGDEDLIPDQNIEASSADGFHNAEFSKLDSGNYWRNAREDANPWIQANLLEISYVHGVVIQGYDGPTSAPCWASKLTIQTGLDVSSIDYIRSSCDEPPMVFTGNSRNNANSPVQVLFPRVVVALIVRLEPMDCYLFDHSSPQCTVLFDVMGCVS
ncbi:lactadherin-like [Amphiura filiformis]|uniref:lactadherin-like n=1 Tax=Amphiura filiformis TaxID=82378 RepID=UPI003B21C85D